MLKWVQGARSGKKTKRETLRSSDDVVASKKKYEEKRSRGFQTHWQVNRPWLTYDNTVCLMHCEYCRQTSKSNKFATGTDNFRIDSVQAHEASTAHIAAASVCVRPTIRQSQAGKALHQLKKHEYDRLNILFRNAHAVVKNHLSFKSYLWLCKLDCAKGIDVGGSYLTDKKAKEFVQHIAVVAKQETNTSLHHAKFVSATCDGTSDSMGDEYESLFVRTCVKGRIEERFLCLGTAVSASSSDIFAFIKQKLTDDCNGTYDKLVGFCSDGASNMQGIRNGVSAKLKEDHPQIVVIHCLAHRLELAFRDAIKLSGNKYYDKTITLLLGLYYLYRRGPKQKAALRRAFEALHIKVVLPTRIGGTRWLPHLHRALDNFLKGYQAFRAHLAGARYDKNAKADGFERLASDAGVIVFILNLKEIISPLMKLSLALQKRECTLADQMFRVAATKDVLKTLKAKPNDEIQNTMADATYQGQKLHGATSLGYREELIDKLIASLEQRFPSNAVLDGSLITSFRNWPSKDNSEDILDFGVKAVDTVKANMSLPLERVGVCLSELQTEWTLLKSLTYSRFSSKLEDSTLVWDHVFHALPSCDLDNITAVIDLLLSLPPTSVNNESLFSRSKLTKGNRRGNLSTETLNDLLVVEMETQDIMGFNPKEAIDHWMTTPSGRQRRIGYTRIPMTVTQTETAPHTDSFESGEVPGTAMAGSAEDIAVPEVLMHNEDHTDVHMMTYETDSDFDDSESENELEEKDVNKNLKLFMKET